MPPPLAAALSLILTVVLLWWDGRNRKDLSWATWIPTLWLLVIGSRSVTQWLYLGTPDDQIGASIAEGSALDRNYFLILILCALTVLIRRGIEWQYVARLNGWFILFLVYGLISVTWSDFPLVAFKRWFKALGDPLIVLVLLTERNPAVAVTAVLRRIAFILLPLSVVFIKYFPTFGRTYSPWDGVATYTGVTTNKNLLGYLLFAAGLLFICTWAERKRIQDKFLRRIETGICALFLFFTGYLFNLANSMTALIGLVTSATVAIAVSRGAVRRHVGAIAVVLLGGTWMMMGTHLSANIFAFLGRDVTLTGRTDLWAAVLPMAVNPLFGAGFESFWLGTRLDSLWAEFAFRPNQAHNGYIDLYLNVGVVGLALFVVFVISSFVAVRRKLATTYETLATAHVDEVILARFGIGYVIAMVAYNVTEATFRSLNFLFVVLLLMAVRYRATSAHESALVGAHSPPRRVRFSRVVTATPRQQSPAGRRWAIDRKRPVGVPSR
jgi:exopolysaccharide production protein ExoQ